jgi:hypothetical protein
MKTRGEKKGQFRKEKNTGKVQQNHCKLCIFRKQRKVAIFPTFPPLTYPEAYL